MMSESIAEQQKLIEFVVNEGNGVKGLSQTNLKSIPEKFILTPEERLDQTIVTAQKSIPTIDVSKWDDPQVADADSICKAAAQWGFFQIINHGIPIEVLENVKKAAHDFFELPVKERRKYLKENSPTPSVELMNSHSPLVAKVLEWKDFLIHIRDGQEIEDSKFWPPVSR
ncbi:Feruloyl CoA ortho-hydroxylase 1 [Forsythia ovata]|uniref:Feruloyl CoA ortho-hydroxylase 1 n=1 Tax=Forsythia ovata TaxID=205694 RepID=A0ABD1VF54_9LAMI